MSGFNWMQRQIRMMGPNVIQIILIANFAIFALSLLVSGPVSQMLRLEGAPSPNAPALILLGANTPAGVFDGEIWRLVSYGFLHGGLLHLAVNSFCIWQLGRLALQILGPARFLTLYLLCLIVAGVASAVWKGPDAVAPSVGASGAAFGLMGYLIGYLRDSRDAVGVSIRNQLVTWMIINVVIGLSLPMIDNAAHFGGGLCGFAFAWVFSKARYRNTREILNSSTTTLVMIVVTLAALGWTTFDFALGSGRSFREVMPYYRISYRVESLEKMLNSSEKPKPSPDQKRDARSTRDDSVGLLGEEDNWKTRAIAGYADVLFQRLENRSVPPSDQFQTKKNFDKLRREILEVLRKFHLRN